MVLFYRSSMVSFSKRSIAQHLKTALALLLVAVPIGSAQTGAGNIQGTVKDATGAVIPAAKVTLVHVATARQYTTQTNEVGFFLFPSIQVGAYEISVEAPGMEAWKARVTLIAGQTAELSANLKVGTTTTQVEVAGSITPLVTTANPTVAAVVERERIEQLPMDGRFFTTLVLDTTD